MSAPATSKSQNISPEPDHQGLSSVDEDIDSFLQAEDINDPSDVEAEHEPGNAEAESFGDWDKGVDSNMFLAESTNNLDNPHAQRSARIAVGRAARRQRLQPYQITDVDNFMTYPPSRQLGLFYVDLLSVKNDLHQIILSQPRFTVDDALQKTINTYSVGVLLSERLREYKKGSVDIVLAIIRGNNVNIPANLDKDPYALALIRGSISDSLTQVRSRIKKFINESVIKDWSIYTLASKIIEGTQCNISIPLCARLAVMRDVFNRVPGSKYWDEIDSRLTHYRTRAGSNADQMRKILSGMLRRDRMNYGVKEPAYSIPDHITGFQQNIDDNL